MKLNEWHRHWVTELGYYWPPYAIWYITKRIICFRWFWFIKSWQCSKLNVRSRWCQWLRILDVSRFFFLPKPSADSFSSRFYIFQSKSILKSVCGHTDSYLQKWILKDSYRSLTCKNELMLLVSGDWVLESLHGLHAFWHKTLPSIRIIFLFILSTCECNAISILTKHLSHLWSLLSQVEIQQQQ